MRTDPTNQTTLPQQAVLGFPTGRKRLIWAKDSSDIQRTFSAQRATICRTFQEDMQ